MQIEMITANEQTQAELCRKEDENVIADRKGKDSKRGQITMCTLRLGSHSDRLHCTSFQAFVQATM